MLYELCSIILNEFYTFADHDEGAPDSIANSSASTFVSMTLIDHMRDRKTYLKILSQWSDDLEVVGRVVIVTQPKKMILMILLSESLENLKTFHSNHKTQIVDIDSGGRPCRERQMKILFPPGKVDVEKLWTDFQMIEVPNDSFKSQNDFLKCFKLYDILEKFLPL